MNTHGNTRKLQLRFVAILFMVLAVLFGIDFSGGYCLGEWILSGIGMPIYSNGTEGWFYPGVISNVGLAAAFAIFACTTAHKLRTFSYFLGGLLIVSFVYIALPTLP